MNIVAIVVGDHSAGKKKNKLNSTNYYIFVNTLRSSNVYLGQKFKYDYKSL